MPATAPTQIYTLSLHDALPISAGLGTGGKLPSRGSHDRGYSSGDPARRFDIDAGGAALSRPYQGVQRHVRQPAGRSEEHTSELQSRFDLVCRLVLEKKKTADQP